MDALNTKGEVWFGNIFYVDPTYKPHKVIAVYQDWEGTHASKIIEERKYIPKDGSNKMKSTSVWKYKSDLVIVRDKDFEGCIEKIKEKRNVDFVRVDMNGEEDKSWRAIIEKAEKKKRNKEATV